jgi:hypothetical protein
MATEASTNLHQCHTDEFSHSVPAAVLLEIVIDNKSMRTSSLALSLIVYSILRGVSDGDGDSGTRTAREYRRHLTRCQCPQVPPASESAGAGAAGGTRQGDDSARTRISGSRSGRR